MKLSQLNNEQAADALLLIAPYAEELINDDELTNLIKSREVTKDKKKAKRLGGVTILRIAAYLLAKHRQAAWGILAALNQKTIDEYRRQAFPQTIKQLVEAFNDDELYGFFSLSVPLAAMPRSESLPE